MSRSRQSDAITTLARDYASGAVVPTHLHDRDQLVYGSNGVMTIHTGLGVWVTPPNRAVWIPAGAPHSIRMSGGVSMRTLYLRPDLVRGLPRACCVVGVSSLLKELVLHICARGLVTGVGADDRCLVGFLASQLQALRALPLELPAPQDRRARRLADRLASRTGLAAPIASLCREAGASRRTVERLFHDETGLSLGRWRQQLRLVRALEKLGEGASVAEAAFETGYASTSAFCVAFRKALGATPSAYFAEPPAPPAA